MPKEELKETNQMNFNANFNSKRTTDGNPLATEVENYCSKLIVQLYIQMYTATSVPSYTPSISQPFPTSVPRYFAHGNYSPAYPRFDYMVRPTEQPPPGFSYPNYGHEYSRSPGISTYPTARSYPYPYGQPEGMYGYDPRTAMGNYYTPPRTNNWLSPSYEHSKQYYATQPSTLRSVPRYQPLDYRVSPMEYRPRATTASYSPFLENFKQNLTYARNINIEELKGHMLELSRDQFGSRHLQQRIQENTPEEKEIIYKELESHINELMTDAFGNYVVQMLIQYGLPNQRDELIILIITTTSKLAFDMYGCRCLQKALTVGTLDQRIEIVSRLKDNMAECMENQHASHVLQKCIECIDPAHVSLLLDYVKSNAELLSCSIYEYRIVMKIVEKVNVSYADAIIYEIVKSAINLSKHQYGNYVVQTVLNYGQPQHKEKIVRQLKDHILDLSSQKYSSNVIEMCFRCADEKSQELLIHAILGKEGINNNIVSDP
jgi:hypothetical protein